MEGGTDISDGLHLFLIDAEQVTTVFWLLLCELHPALASWERIWEQTTRGVPSLSVSTWSV